MLFMYSHGRKIPVNGKILFLGDSITDMGMYITYLQAYLDLYQPGNGLTLYNLGLGAETVCGLTEPGHPYPRPDVNERLDRVMLTIEPHWVFVMYGMNDGIYYPFSEEHFAAYKEGLWKVIHRLQEYDVRIVVMTPSPFEPQANPEGLQYEAERYGFDRPYAGYDEVLSRYGQFIMEEVAPEVDKVMDIHAALAGGLYTPDRVHPGWEGHLEMARTILREAFEVHTEKIGDHIPQEYLDKAYVRDQLLHAFYVEAAGHKRPGHFEVDTYDRTLMKAHGLTLKLSEYTQAHPELFAPLISEWNGFRREDFFYRGYEAIVVRPDPEMENGSWIWRTEFFDAFATVDLEMVRRGFTLAYYRVSDQYGAPQVLPYMETFYHYMRETYHLSQGVIPFGFSRGGLYALLLAEAHPSWIRALYLDAPCVDIRTWPKESSPKEWMECLAAWETDEKGVASFGEVLENRIQTVSLSQIPLALVYGEADDVVPYDRNGALLEKAYQEAEVSLLCIGKPGCGHHPHSLTDPAPVADFLCNTEDPGTPPSSFVNIRRFR